MASFQLEDLYVDLHFIKGAFVEIRGKGNRDLRVEFVDRVTGEVVFAETLTPGRWARTSRRWYTPWRVRILHDGEPVLTHDLDCQGRRVYIALDSRSLGDTLAWIPYVEAFAGVHDCQVTTSTFWNEMLAPAYPALTFVEPGDTVHDLVAMYTLGCFTTPTGDTGARAPTDHRLVPLQRAASDILGLEYVERRPRVVVPGPTDPITGRHVCIAEHSTTGARYWHREGGWQAVVDALADRGIRTVAVSHEPTSLRGVLDRTGRPIDQAMADIAGAEAFIGLSSGLSWLAWAEGVPVVLISGCSAPWCEFSSGVVRLHDDRVCHSCWNDPRHEFDAYDWDWCPRHRGTSRQFECSTAISADRVVDALVSLVAE